MRATNALVILLGIGVAGCANVPAPAPVQTLPVIDYIPKVVDTGCSWSKLILVAKDKLTDAQAAPILAQANADAMTMGAAKAMRKAMRATGIDVLTDVTTKQILSHDNAWTANCGKK